MKKIWFLVYTAVFGGGKGEENILPGMNLPEKGKLRKLCLKDRRNNGN